MVIPKDGTQIMRNACHIIKGTITSEYIAITT